MSYYIGLMVGSSADSIDACIIKSSEQNAKIITALNYPLSYNLKKQLLNLHPTSNINILSYHSLELELSKACVKAAKAVMQQAALTTVKGLGVHGYTCLHQASLSIQMINAGFLSQKLNLPVVTDFRSMDVFANGQGAPFAPAFHEFLWAGHHPNIAVVNIGGMANVSAWHKKKLIGFDIGPGNVWLDSWVRLHKNQDYDVNGSWAATATYDIELLKHLSQHDFFHKAPPKSTSRDDFNLATLQQSLQDFKHLSAVVVQATLTELTAQTIIKSINDFIPWHKSIYVCGGGAYNSFLLSRMQAQTKVMIQDTSKIGWSPNWLEAAAFAWLAQQRLKNKAVKINSVTGADDYGILGAVYAWSIN